MNLLIKKTVTHFVFIFSILAIAACNIYKPLSKAQSTEDIIEDAQKCLHDNDYACAIENYLKLPSGELRAQKLCTVSLARGGFTLTALINVIQTRSNKMLGLLANTLAPFSDAK